MSTFIELLYIRNNKYCVNINRDKKALDTYCMVVEIWVKDKDLLRHSLQRHKLMNNPAHKIEEWVSNTQRFGLASHRPYSPGQACDGTISACVIALFTDFCKKRSVNPVKIWNKAYPEERPKLTKRELAETKSFAEWQGVQYPKQWDAINVESLFESLHHANYHQLATTVAEELGIAK